MFEPLRAAYPWHSERFHTFVHDGMRANERAFTARGVRYVRYVEPTDGDDKGLLHALAARACAVVTDVYPTYFLPRMVAAAARVLPVRAEGVDGLGIVPLAATPKAFTVAHAFRRWLHKELPAHLARFPEADPLAGYDLGLAPVPDLSRWPSADRLDVGGPGAVSRQGGWEEAHKRLGRFLTDGLPRYADDRNHPDEDAASGLSPWLHFGHLSAHEVVDAVLRRDRWSPDRLAPAPTGQREGWWGLSAEAEAFLDELITWREVGHVFAHHVPNHDQYSSLPDWARATLDAHRADARQVLPMAQLDDARTPDPIWNAAQRELRRTGVMHNYLRMLWGKNVIAWSSSPEEALERLIELNNRYALDGRDPNSYSGIFWVFGRFDRAWGPERPIFGTVRYMTSASTQRKLHMKEYLRRFGDSASPGLPLRPSAAR